MPDEEQALRNIVHQLEDAWNKGDSVAWTKLFAGDADFIHVLGGHFNGAASIEQGHRIIFDTIYKGSTNKFEVEKVRFAGDSVAIVFLFATLKVVQSGLPPQLNARPTMVLQRTGSDWKIVAFQNTMVTPEGVPQSSEALAAKHPIKGGGASEQRLAATRARMRHGSGALGSGGADWRKCHAAGDKPL